MKEINTVKELMKDEELAKFVTEDLEDFDEESKVTYEVWALGYDSNDKITDAEMLLGEFSDPDQAVEKAKETTIADVVHKAAEEDANNDLEVDVVRLSIEVETVVDDGEEGTMNVGTIYKRELWIDGEYGDEDCVEENDVDPIVDITAKDYTLDEDGNLTISCEVLKNYNKNDYVRIHFVDEAESGSFTYKIISKTTANKFVCEFIY
jgi:hypothetical protein